MTKIVVKMKNKIVTMIKILVTVKDRRTGKESGRCHSGII